MGVSWPLNSRNSSNVLHETELGSFVEDPSVETNGSGVVPVLVSSTEARVGLVSLSYPLLHIIFRCVSIPNGGFLPRTHVHTVHIEGLFGLQQT